MPEKATSEKPEEKEPETGKREPAAKAPQKKRWPIVVGVIVVVLVVAGMSLGFCMTEGMLLGTRIAKGTVS